MTPEQRDKLMDKWLAAKNSLAFLDPDDDDDKEAIQDVEYDIWKIEKQFPECRYWGSRKTPETERRKMAETGLDKAE